MFTPEAISELVREIRLEHGLPESPFRIDEVRYDPKGDKLFIIAHDRTDKSVVIGNSLVIGKLRERLGVKQVTVYSNLDLEIKRKTLDEAERLLPKELEFLTPIIEAERRFPPREWPEVTGNLKTLVFLSFSAKPLLGFAKALKLPYGAIGLRYTFPRLEYEAVEGGPRELFFPNEDKLVRIAGERGARLVLADFPFPLDEKGGVYLLNPFRLLHIGFFELKYLFGFEFPTMVDEKALLEFVAKLTYDGLMESTDGAKVVWRYWRRRR
ncbi:hypothetical protein [Thermococcus nautili]|uniref:Putative ATPase (PP-loop superfamily) n=1 Tax=Thermococcus nautili TaxID=195522 RepID=W8P5R4_9EURY|nr:hypothetical protein [Thermococcus nautili]AHL22835.1 putative ATPase (PP-loop superfamily) [Thermococcus nautili]